MRFFVAFVRLVFRRLHIAIESSFYLRINGCPYFVLACDSVISSKHFIIYTILVFSWFFIFTAVVVIIVKCNKYDLNHYDIMRRMADALIETRLFMLNSLCVCQINGNVRRSLFFGRRGSGNRE